MVNIQLGLWRLVGRSIGQRHRMRHGFTVRVDRMGHRSRVGRYVGSQQMTTTIDEKQGRRRESRLARAAQRRVRWACVSAVVAIMTVAGAVAHDSTVSSKLFIAAIFAAVIAHGLWKDAKWYTRLDEEAGSREELTC